MTENARNMRSTQTKPLPNNGEPCKIPPKPASATQDGPAHYFLRAVPQSIPYNIPNIYQINTLLTPKLWQLQRSLDYNPLAKYDITG